MIQILQSALVDVGDGLRRHRVWRALAREDVGDQHRRTTLGPLWLLVNYLSFLGTFVFVMNPNATPHYAVYVATGLLIWFYMMEVMTLSVSLFVREMNMIKGTTLPITAYVMRLTMQSLIRATYAFVGCVAIIFLVGDSFHIIWLWSIVGIALIIIATPAVILVVAFVGAYMPDLQFVISNLMRVGMFLTPIFWTHQGSGGIRHLLYYWNPFAHFVEIFRTPIVNGTVPYLSLTIVICSTVAMWVCALLLLGGLRRKVVFVL